MTFSTTSIFWANKFAQKRNKIPVKINLFKSPHVYCSINIYKDRIFVQINKNPA